jgi:hypothetical protein
VFWLTPKVNLDDTVLDWLEDDEQAEETRKDGSPNAA